LRRLTVTARKNDTLDLICWRHFRQTAAVTEMVIEMNPQLARQGLILAEGTPVILPDAAPARHINRIELWS